MRKSLAVAIASVVLLVLWSGQNLIVKAQGGAGGSCVTEVAYDANGDGTVDISDPIRLLNWIFMGGEPPCAFAGGCGVCLTSEQAQMLDDLAFGRKVAGTYGKRFPDTGILSFSADGGFEQDNWEQFGGFGPEVTDYFASTWRGTWKQVGEIEDRRIQVRATRMNFAEDGTPWCFCEMRAEGTFAPDFKTFTATWTAKACLWNSWSPTSCEQASWFEGSVFGTRISIED